ncbi:Translation initiation factor eIF-2B subunit epsilon [Bagarius yarrelli]|uniref:Translation initiation factor eIF-2B subunit epsilon n=1 Tax=Bagarius yarrelli TaxID=175774 RepID=A0A556VWP1_BAGYA|nr:Translation initiation factor eIF-2B subunit epsilon [Bagarius yarrelli]
MILESRPRKPDAVMRIVSLPWIPGDRVLHYQKTQGLNKIHSLWNDFVRGILVNEEILGNQIHMFVSKDGYGARVSNLHMYDSVSCDLIGRWAYPITPEANFSDEEGRSCTHSRHNVYREVGVGLGHGSLMEENVLIGRNSVIGANCSLSNTVIGANCLIGDGVVLDRAFIWNNVRISDGVTVCQSVICDGVESEASEGSHDPGSRSDSPELDDVKGGVEEYQVESGVQGGVTGVQGGEGESRECRVESRECRVESRECRVESRECRVESRECRVESRECRVESRKCRVDLQGFRGGLAGVQRWTYRGRRWGRRSPGVESRQSGGELTGVRGEVTGVQTWKYAYNISLKEVMQILSRVILEFPFHQHGDHITAAQYSALLMPLIKFLEPPAERNPPLPFKHSANNEEMIEERLPGALEQKEVYSPLRNTGFISLRRNFSCDASGSVSPRGILLLPHKVLRAAPWTRDR